MCNSGNVLVDGLFNGSKKLLVIDVTTNCGWLDFKTAWAKTTTPKPLNAIKILGVDYWTHDLSILKKNDNFNSLIIAYDGLLI